MYARIISIKGDTVDYRTRNYKNEKALMKHGVKPVIKRSKSMCLVDVYSDGKRVSQNIL